MTKAKAYDIRIAADELRAAANVLPRIDVASGRDLMEQHREHHAAAERLAAWLSEHHGARVHQKSDGTHAINMCGIRSSSTGGLAATFVNWIAAAERKLG